MLGCHTRGVQENERYYNPVHSLRLYDSADFWPERKLIQRYDHLLISSPQVVDWPAHSFGEAFSSTSWSRNHQHQWNHLNLKSWYLSHYPLRRQQSQSSGHRSPVCPSRTHSPGLLRPPRTRLRHQLIPERGTWSSSRLCVVDLVDTGLKKHRC